MLDFSVAEHEFHPPFGERRLLRAQRRDKALQSADRCLAHGSFPLAMAPLAPVMVVA
jgi:hypothetical protein